MMITLVDLILVMDISGRSAKIDKKTCHYRKPNLNHAWNEYGLEADVLESLALAGNCHSVRAESFPKRTHRIVAGY